MISVLLSFTCSCLKLTVCYAHLPQFLFASPAQETEKDISSAERERVRKLIHRLHDSGGHVSKTSLRLLLQRRGCPVWMQHMVDQLQCDSCLESRLSTESFFALYKDADCKLSSCSCCLEGNPRQRFEPNGATLISHLGNDWIQHYQSSNF